MLEKNSYNKFKEILGDYDATNECIELIIREALCQYTSDDLEKMSEQHSIKVDTLDKSKNSRRS